MNGMKLRSHIDCEMSKGRIKRSNELLPLLDNAPAVDHVVDPGGWDGGHGHTGQAWPARSGDAGQRVPQRVVTRRAVP